MTSPASTALMARIVGPFLVVTGAAVALRAATIGGLIGAFAGDQPLLLIAGSFTLAMGLAMIAAHNRWNNPAAIVISLLGWGFSLRGAVLLLAPGVVTTAAAHLTAAPLSPTAPQIIGAVLALIGAWLSFVGWFGKPSS